MTREDAISRQEVINHICESQFCYKEECKGRIYKRCSELQWVYDLPSVTPTRKKGKWEYDAYKDRNGGHCNQCGHFMRYGAKTNFCPDCGAEMENKE